MLFDQGLLKFIKYIFYLVNIKGVNMQNQNDQFINASNDYSKRLNTVNLLLLKEHTFLLQKKQYEQQIAQVDKLILELTENPEKQAHLSVEAEFDHLHKIIKSNKKQIAHLSSKLQQKDVMINSLSSLSDIRKKYEKLIDTEYQNGIQQKLSTIRGKVDDLKKKIKEINKDILSYEQDHSEMIDDFSFQIKTLETYREKNKQLIEEIQRLRNESKK